MFLYLAALSDRIFPVVLIPTVIYMVAVFMTWLASFADEKIDHKDFRKILLEKNKKYIYASIFAWFVLFFIPDKTTLYMMAGANVIERVAADPETRELVDMVKSSIKKELQK